MSALRYSWDDPADARSFRLSFASCDREPANWKEELYAAARHVANRAMARNKPLWVCASGGIDSEIACRAFYDQGIEFSVLTLEHIGGTNRHDVRFARSWCERRGVKQEIVPLDVQRFLSEEITRYTEQVLAIHPFRYLQIKLIELIEERHGFAVLGSGGQTYQVRTSGDTLRAEDVYVPLSNGTVLADEWCRMHGIEHEASFHFATPELCLSYLRLPLVDFVLKHPVTVFRHPVNTYTFTRLVCLSIWDDVEPRYKWHGFENVRTDYEAAKRRLRAQFSQRFAPIHLPVIELRRQLESSLMARTGE